MSRAVALLIVLFAVPFFAAGEAAAQTTEFAYQGFLKDGAAAANGNYDFEFRLFDQPTGGVQIGITLQRLSIPVVQGSFTVFLDFGSAAFNGPDRLIGIDVRPTGGGAFVPLSPRQKVNSAPYSVRSLNSASADQANNAAQLGGVAAGQYVITTDPRMSDARNPLANSPNYIQNTAVQQAASNFNISGNGTAAGTLSGNQVNAVTQYNFGGQRILGAQTNNFIDTLFVGIGAGSSNSTGINNVFVGKDAGLTNTTGLANTFIGAYSGSANTVGQFNTYVGQAVGIGSTGSFNTIMGGSTAQSLTTGNSNSIFGVNAGNVIQDGNENSFFGRAAGLNTTAGSLNAFIGRSAGAGNTTGSNNSALGAGTSVGNTLTFATALGSGASVSTNNTVVIGRAIDTVQIPGGLSIAGAFNATLPTGSNSYIQNTATQQAASNFNISGNGTVGGTLSGNAVNAATQYNIGGSRILGNSGTNNLFSGIGAGGSNTSGTNNSFFGAGAGSANTTGSANSFFGYHAGEEQTGERNSFFGDRSGLNTTGNNNNFFGSAAGLQNTTGENNVFIGNQAGRNNISGSNNVFIGEIAGISNSGSDNTAIGGSANVPNGLTNATALGSRASVTLSNSLILGSIGGVNGATADTNVGIGTTAPARRLHVSSGSSGATSLGSTDLVVEDNAAAFQHFLTPDDNESGLLFGDPTDSIGGGIIFNNAATNNGIMFRSGGNVTRMVLDGSGNLGLGILAPQDRLDVIGSIRLSALGAPGATHLCRNASNQISTCASPRPDFGGEAVTSSVEELRTEITKLKLVNAEQQKQIEALLRIACSQTSDPAVCR